MNILLAKTQAVRAAFETKGTFYISPNGQIEGKHNYTGNHIMKVYYDKDVVKIETKEGIEKITSPSKLRNSITEKTGKSDKRKGLATSSEE